MLYEVITHLVRAEDNPAGIGEGAIMIRTLPLSRGYSWGFKLYVCCFYLFLFAPLIVTCVLAFNNSDFPSLPWKGFSLDWFLADGPERVGIFHDSQNLQSIWVSAKTAFWVSILSYNFV